MPGPPETPSKGRCCQNFHSFEFVCGIVLAGIVLGLVISATNEQWRRWAIQHRYAYVDPVDSETIYDQARVNEFWARNPPQPQESPDAR